MSKMSEALKNYVPKTTVGKGRNYLSTEEGAGMTAAGRAAYNRANDSNLKPPAPNPKTDKDKARKKSFCSRMKPIADKSERGSRARASMQRWNCS
jgi:hypothetical protein